MEAQDEVLRLRRRLSVATTAVGFVAVLAVIALVMQFRRQGALETRLATLESRSVAIDGGVRHVLVQLRRESDTLRFARAELPGLADPWTLPSGAGAVTHGELPPAGTGIIELPAVGGEGVRFLDASVTVRTSNRIEESPEAPNRFFLRCLDAGGREQKARLAANFFRLDLRVASDPSTKEVETSCGFRYEGEAHLAIEVDARSLATNLKEGGICDFLVRLGPSIGVVEGGR